MYHMTHIFSFTLITSTSAINFPNFDFPPKPDPSFNFSYTLLQKYEQHDLVLHVDNQSIHFANTFLSMYSVVTTLYNHDLDNTTLTRPAGLKCINIVSISNPSNIWTYLLRNDNIFPNDILVFVVNSHSFTLLKRNFLAIPNLSRFERVLVFIYGVTTARMFTFCFYCGLNVRVKFLQTFKYADFTLKDEDLFQEKVTDFNGHLFRISYIDYFPYIYCVEKNVNNDSICEKAVGVDYELLTTLKDRLNFTYELIEVAGSNYNNLFHDLITEKYDLAIGGLTMTNARRKILQFSSVLKFEPIAFMFMYRKPFLKNFVLLHAVSFDMKILLAVTHWVVVLFLYFFNKCGNNGNGTLSVSKLFLLIVQSAAEQPIKRLNSLIPTNFRWSVPILLTSWWFYNTILNTSFRSVLTATTVRNPKTSITPAELVNSGYHLVLDNFMTNSFVHSLSKEGRRFVNRSTVIYTNNTCQALYHTYNEKAIWVGEVSNSLIHTKVACPDYRTRIPPGTHFQSFIFQLSPHAWPFKYKAPYIGAFNEHIKRATNGGLIIAWARKVLFKEAVHAYPRKYSHDGHKRIRFDAYFFHFVTYFFMISVAIVAFFAEQVYYNLTKR